MTSHRQKWDEQLRDALAECQGEFLMEVWVDEMGLYGPDEHPIFSHPHLDFVQALILELRFASGGTLRIGCWQDNDEFALWPRRVSAEDRLSPIDDPSRTLFRVRPMSEFPIGQINSIKWKSDDRGNIQLVRISFDRNTVLLRAGEVYENYDGSLVVRDKDESVLIFMDQLAHDRTIFNAPVYRIV